MTTSPLPSREAIDTALYLLDGSGPARSSGIAQLTTLLKDPSFRADSVLEERLSSLLQVLIGQVARMEEGGSAIAWQAFPIDSETVNALGCLLTGPSLRESSLAAGAMPAQAKAAERRLQQSLARKALHALCQLCVSAPARSELQECSGIVISTVLRKATLPASAVVPEAEHCVRALAKSLADRPYATDPVAAEAAVMGLRALISVDRDQLQRCVALWVGPVCSCALRVIEPQTKRGGGDGGQGAGQDGSGRGQGSGAAAVAAGGDRATRERCAAAYPPICRSGVVRAGRDDLRGDLRGTVVRDRAAAGRQAAGQRAAASPALARRRQRRRRTRVGGLPSPPPLALALALALIAN